MNKGVLTVIIIAIVAALGGGAYFFTQNQSESVETDETNTNQTANQNTNNTSESHSGTLSSLLRLGQNYTCTYDTIDSAGNVTNGTVYVAASGDKFSGSFNVSQLGEDDVTTYVIRDGTYNYMWTSASVDGYKTRIEGNETQFFGGDSAGNTSTGISEDDTYNFDCRPWTVDDTRFVPPTTIDFVDLSAQIEEMQEQVQDTLQAQCTTCEQIPDATARAACLQNLGCN